MTQQSLLMMGVLLVFIGIFFIFAASLINSGAGAKVAVGGFIGPIPFGFASNPRLLKMVMVVSFVLFVIFIITAKFLVILK